MNGLTALVLLPAFAALLTRLAPTAEGARRAAIAGALATLLASLLVVASFDLGAPGMQMEWAGAVVPWARMQWHVGVDGLSVVLLPLTSLIGVATTLGLPRQSMNRASLAATLLTVSATLGLFVTLDLAWLAVFWLVRLAPGLDLIAATPDPDLRRHVRRTWWVFLVAGSAPLFAAVIALGVLGNRAGLAAPFDLVQLTAMGVPRAWQLALFPALVVAVGMRMAVVPFHGWMSVLLEHGPPGVALLITGAHVALYAIARIILPLLPDACAVGMGPLMIAALLCALYGSVVALAQDDLRRMVAYLAVSHAGLMAGGLASMNAQSVAGSLLQSVASGLSLTGLLIIIRALHARTGTSHMDDHGGIARSAPRMSVFFLLFGLAAVGFPTTITYVSEDLLLHGVLDAHPLMAVLLLLATALNGITLLRAFFRTFMGPPPRGAPGGVDDLVPRERAVAFLLTTSIFLGGLYPRPLLEARQPVVAAIVSRDAHRAPHGH